MTTGVSVVYSVVSPAKVSNVCSYEGKGWYVSNQMERVTGSLLFVDSAGNATILNAPESFPIWAVPSPDGRHLAFTSYPGIQNAWMIENF